jgi:DNA-binding NarL/FixJ family response regulator
VAAPISVLIVEDHAVLAEALTARVDREQDIRVVGCTAAAAQVPSMVEVRRPDVVLIDVELGNNNGLDLIGPIHDQPSGAKVVVLTCRSDTETMLTALRRGASAFVPKSAPIADLLCAIRTVAMGDMWVSPAVLGRILPEVLQASEGKQAKSQMPALTDREREVLTLMVEGYANPAIAERLHLSIHTVRTHAHNLQRKLNVHSKLAAVALAHEFGFTKI